MAPVAGSAYTYAYATLGELLAWIIGWDLILEYAMACASVAAAGRNTSTNSSTSSSAGKMPAVPLLTTRSRTPGAWFNLPAVLITLLVTVILVIGIRESATTNAVLVGRQARRRPVRHRRRHRLHQPGQLDRASRPPSASCPRSDVDPDAGREAVKQTEPTRPTRARARPLAVRHAALDQARREAQETAARIERHGCRDRATQAAPRRWRIRRASKQGGRLTRIASEQAAAKAEARPPWRADEATDADLPRTTPTRRWSHDAYWPRSRQKAPTRRRRSGACSATSASTARWSRSTTRSARRSCPTAWPASCFGASHRLLRLHRLRLDLDALRGGQEAAARRAHRHPRLAGRLHRAVHRRVGGHHRHGAVPRDRPEGGRGRRPSASGPSRTTARCCRRRRPDRRRAPWPA